MTLKYTLKTVLVILIIYLSVTCQGNTFKPFVRSRYSLRWRITTETPKTMDSTTSAFKQEGVNTMRAFKSLETSSTLRQNMVPAISTVQPLIELKTSTHPPDYDYYGNNDVEENEHKN